MAVAPEADNDTVLPTSAEGRFASLAGTIDASAVTTSGMTDQMSYRGARRTALGPSRTL